MKAGAILLQTNLYGGVKQFIELGRVFKHEGHEFIIYTPTGDVPASADHDIRIASFADLENDSNDMLILLSG